MTKLLQSIRVEGNVKAYQGIRGDRVEKNLRNVNIYVYELSFQDRTSNCLQSLTPLKSSRPFQFIETISCPKVIHGEPTTNTALKKIVATVMFQGNTQETRYFNFLLSSTGLLPFKKIFVKYKYKGREFTYKVKTQISNINTQFRKFQFYVQFQATSTYYVSFQYFTGYRKKQLKVFFK